VILAEVGTDITRCPDAIVNVHSHRNYYAIPIQLKYRIAQITEILEISSNFLI